MKCYSGEIQARIAKAVEDASSRVQVQCDEYHAHTVACLSGTDADIALLATTNALGAATHVLDKLAELRQSLGV